MARLESIRQLMVSKFQKKTLHDAYLLGIAQQVIGRRGKAVSIRQGVLKVTTDDPMVGFELTTHQQDLIAIVNQKLLAHSADQSIDRLKVVVQ